MGRVFLVVCSATFFSKRPNSSCEQPTRYGEGRLSGQRSNPMRLVLCDDNRIFCEALAVALEARGHQALAIATTADEGVAAGFFGKDQDLDKIAIALDAIAAGRVTSPPEPPGEDRLSALTPRETEVLRRIAAGQSTKTMAREMS